MAATQRAYNPIRMKVWKQLVARRQRKAHERYLRERARQRELEGQDVEEAIRGGSLRSGGNMQGGFPQ